MRLSRGFLQVKKISFHYQHELPIDIVRASASPSAVRVEAMRKVAKDASDIINSTTGQSPPSSPNLKQSPYSVSFGTFHSCFFIIDTAHPKSTHRSAPFSPTSSFSSSPSNSKYLTSSTSDVYLNMRSRYTNVNYNSLARIYTTFTLSGGESSC